MTQMVQYALSCIQPGQQYLTTHAVGESLREPLAAFKAARLLNPHKVAEILATASDVDDLASFPFVTSVLLSDLKAELPSYAAKADGIDSSFCRLRWWKNNSTCSFAPLGSTSSSDPIGTALFCSCRKDFLIACQLFW